MHTSRRSAVAATVGVLLLAAGAGAGWAADALTPGTITSCVTVNGGAMRFVESPQDCQPVERRVAWQSGGAPGPAGPAGPAGAQGPKGKDAATYAVKAGPGGLVKAPAGTTMSRPHTGRYDVTLPEDVSSCVATVSSTSMAQQSVITQGRTVIVQFQQTGYYYSQAVDTDFSLAVLC